MADPMFESNDDKLLKDMYGEDAARFSGKDSMFSEAHSSATGACSETFDEEAGGRPAKKAPHRPKGPQGAAAFPDAIDRQKYIGAKPPAHGDAAPGAPIYEKAPGGGRAQRSLRARVRAPGVDPSGYAAAPVPRARRTPAGQRTPADRARRLLMGVLAATVCLMLAATALTASSGGQLSVLRRALPTAFVQKAEAWNGRGQTARSAEFLRGNGMGYFRYNTGGELGALAAQTDYARRYEEVFSRWAVTCWDYVQGETDILSTDLSLLGYAVADVMDPDADVPLDAALTRRCQLGVSLFLQDVAGVPEEVLAGFASDRYAVRDDAKRRTERLLEAALPGTAQAYLEGLGYDARRLEGGGEA